MEHNVFKMVAKCLVKSFDTLKSSFNKGYTDIRKITYDGYCITVFDECHEPYIKLTLEEYSKKPLDVFVVKILRLVKEGSDFRFYSIFTHVFLLNSKEYCYCKTIPITIPLDYSNESLRVKDVSLDLFHLHEDVERIIGKFELAENLLK
jgi:hypothetical protein